MFRIVTSKYLDDLIKERDKLKYKLVDENIILKMAIMTKANLEEHIRQQDVIIKELNQQIENLPTQSAQSKGTL